MMKVLNGNPKKFVLMCTVISYSIIKAGMDT